MSARGRADAAHPYERPAAFAPGPARFGSDIVAQALRDTGVPYIALNPGSSYRGLHDSLVNHLGNTAPPLLLCLHEEHAVAIAQGYAKVTGRAMAAAVHSNVGLMHATMAIFNAWCDRMPVLILGANGPADAAKRRPWIEWIHSARDLGALVRPYVKWDDQPASPAAAREAIFRAAWLAQTAPCAPVYVNLDVEMQEAALPDGYADAAPAPARFMPPVRSEATQSQIADLAVRLKAARSPMMLAGRVSRDPGHWQERLRLVEHLSMRVGTDLKVGAAFATDHPLHVGAPGVFPGAELLEALRGADLILSLDWVDLAGTLKAAFGAAAPPFVAQCSLDHVLHNGWSFDHQGLAPVDLMIAADPDAVVAQLCAALKVPAARAASLASAPPPVPPSGKPSVDDLTAALRSALGARDVSLLHLPLSWNGAAWPFRHPLDFLGSDGGGGIGGGPGISVGAALALRDAESPRVPIAICGDGDFLMGVTALWTAVHYRIPLIIVIANNQSFYNDEVHQERVARMRGRPVENKWIGQRMDDPAIDLAGLARAQGCEGIGPVEDAGGLADAFARALAAYDAGRVAVVDVRVKTGYTPAMASALTKAHG